MRKEYPWDQSHERIKVVLKAMGAPNAHNLSRLSGMTLTTCLGIGQRPARLTTLDTLASMARENFDLPIYPLQIYSSQGDLLEPAKLERKAHEYAELAFACALGQDVEDEYRRGVIIGSEEDYRKECEREVLARVCKTLKGRGHKISSKELLGSLHMKKTRPSDVVDRLAFGFGLRIRYLDRLQENY